MQEIGIRSPGWDQNLSFGNTGSVCYADLPNVDILNFYSYNLTSYGLQKIPLYISKKIKLKKCKKCLNISMKIVVTSHIFSQMVLRFSGLHGQHLSACCIRNSWGRRGGARQMTDYQWTKKMELLNWDLQWRGYIQDVFTKLVVVSITYVVSIGIIDNSFYLTEKKPQYQ